MIYIILALISYTAALMFAAVAVRNANTILVTAIMNILSSVIPVTILIPILNKKLLLSSQFGIWMAILSGLFLTVFTLFINKSYELNKVAIVAPIVFGGTIFTTAILSNIFLKEKIDLFQGIGLILLAIGLTLIIYSKTVSK